MIDKTEMVMTDDKCKSADCWCGGEESMNPFDAYDEILKEGYLEDRREYCPDMLQDMYGLDEPQGIKLYMMIQANFDPSGTLQKDQIEEALEMLRHIRYVFQLEGLHNNLAHLSRIRGWLNLHLAKYKKEN